uniref:Gamma-secretase subunit PEN-2 n=1 Tax=Ixodes ricinus TaxID=34613 RepID=V5HEH8_IXORI
MDLAKVKDDEKLRLCRWYYRGGFFILPFLWFVNAVWFFKEAFVRPPFDEQKNDPRLRDQVGHRGDGMARRSRRLGGVLPAQASRVGYHGRLPVLHHAYGHPLKRAPDDRL